MNMCSRCESNGLIAYASGAFARTHRCSFAFSRMFGVTKLAGLTRIRSWVQPLVLHQLGPGTPITLMPTEH